MDHEVFVEEYGAAIEAGQASLLIGTGMSSGAGYPNWADLLEPVAEEFDVPPMTDLPLQAQYIETKAGRDRRQSPIEWWGSECDARCVQPLSWGWVSVSRVSTSSAIEVSDM